MTPDVQQTCLDALAESAGEVAATVLGGLPCASDGLAGDGLSGHGAYLGLVMQEEPIQVGLLVEPAGCQALAKALLGMEPGDEDLPASDVSDAMCEVINIVAGGLKRRVIGRIPVTLGLPIFVSGHPLPNAQQNVVAHALVIGDVAAKLILVTQKSQATSISRSGVSPVAEISKEQSA
jgi:hypothetical protein